MMRAQVDVQALLHVAETALRRMYPDTVTARTRDRWLAQAEQQQQVDLRWETVRQDLHTLAAQQRQQEIGRSGQSYGFGGSSGGGGGGRSGLRSCGLSCI